MWSIVASIAAHFLILLLSPLFIRLDIPPGATAPAAQNSAETFGLEMIVAVASEDAPELPPVEEEQDPVRPEPVRQVTPPAARQPVPPVPSSNRPAAPSAVPGDQTRPSARDALRPGYRDARLYIAPDQYPELRKTEHEVYMEHLQARIDALNDSMMVASNRERTTSDWVYTDSDGKKWGLSPEGLHLGGTTVPRALLPLPGATGDNARLAEERERTRQSDEIRRQAEDQARRETQDERIDATREERNRSRSGDGS